VKLTNLLKENNLDMKDPGVEIAEKAIEEAAEIAREFLGKVANPALEEGGGLIQDTVKFWRFKNQVNILLKAKAFLEGKGLNPHAILPKTLAPLLDSGSLETDSSLQNMWANLLASYARGDLIIQSYPSLLKELSPMEARILTDLNTAREKVGLSGRDLLTHGTPKNEICRVLSISDSQYDVMIDNLVRLNLVQPVGASGALVGDQPLAIKTNEIVHLTALGKGLIDAITAFNTSSQDVEVVSLEKGPEQDNVAKWG
jgi:hypothetical protein